MDRLALGSREGNIELLQILWECAKENLTTEEIINKMLLATDNQGLNVCHMAVQRGIARL